MDDPLPIRNPQIGDYLYASCAGEDYGQILSVGTDANGVPTIDIEVFNPDDMLSYDEDVNALTRLELPPDTKVILRDLQWVPFGSFQDYEGKTITKIECKTPGNNCFRCTKLFALHTERTKFN